MTENNLQVVAEQAVQRYQEGDFEQAAELFAKAAQVHQDAGEALSAAELRNNQCVALLQNNDPQGALDATLGTDVVFAEAGDIRRQGIALGNQASALEELNRIDEALEKYQASADCLDQAGEDQKRAMMMQSIAWIHIKRRNFYEGLFSMNSGLRGLKNPTLKQRILRTILKLRTW